MVHRTDCLLSWSLPDFVDSPITRPSVMPPVPGRSTCVTLLLIVKSTVSDVVYSTAFV